MTKNSRTKRALVAMLAALVMFVSALPVFASDVQTEEVLDQLNTLLNANIDYEWLPDIQANEAVVERLLDAYMECSDAQKESFTRQQNEDLHAYFTALYTVQDRDVEDVDALFETGQDASSSQGTSSSEDEEDSQPAVSSEISSSQVSGTSDESAPSSDTSDVSAVAAVSEESQSSEARLPGSVAQPAASEDVTVIPQVANSPQSPESGGWAAFFGNNRIGTIVLFTLLGLALIFILRFLASLRKAGKVPQNLKDEDARAQELFGENYDPQFEDARMGGLSEDIASAPVKSRAAKNVQVKKKKSKLASLLLEDVQEDMQPQGALVAPSEGVRRADMANARAEESASAVRDAENALSQIKAKGAKNIPPTSPSVQDAKSEGTPLSANVLKTVAEDSDAKPTSKISTPPLVGPDAPNGISLRGFSAPKRTGRPRKMPFRQGSPDDIDGVDE